MPMPLGQPVSQIQPSLSHPNHPLMEGASGNFLANAESRAKQSQQIADNNR